FVFTSLIPSLESILPYKFGIYIPINSVYLFYLLLGYYMHYNKISVNRTVLSLLLIAFACFTILMPLNEDFIDFPNGGRIKLTGDDSPVTVMLSLVVFCLLRRGNGRNEFARKMAPMCFGIYLIHVLFINMLYKFMKITPEKYPLTIVILVTALTAILLSIMFSSIGRRIKILRKYVL
ncbi:MAG: hypothetical protein LBD35_00350, partial [Prevotellaceae bacterium]|nr:hypothetical protein [Prevotellaceae bacterium]